MGRIPRHYDFPTRFRWAGREDRVGNRDAGVDVGGVGSGLEGGLAKMRFKLSFALGDLAHSCSDFLFQGFVGKVLHTLGDGDEKIDFNENTTREIEDLKSWNFQTRVPE